MKRFEIHRKCYQAELILIPIDSVKPLLFMDHDRKGSVERKKSLVVILKGFGDKTDGGKPPVAK
jgi:hypothetical protein